MDRVAPSPAVVVGATGLVGRQVVARLAESGSRVRVLGRRAPRAGEAEFRQLDFESLAGSPDAAAGDFAGVAAVFVALGTTLRAAGSREAFRRVDLDYVVAVGRAARRAGVPHLLAVSSVGAGVGASTFYLQVKGEAEEALQSLAFPSLTLARPSLLLGEREERRPLERVSGVVLGLVRPLLRGPFDRYRPIPAATVARALVRSAADPTPGVTILESHHLALLGS